VGDEGGAGGVLRNNHIAVRRGGLSASVLLSF
jgi:hypothetical protein